MAIRPLDLADRPLVPVELQPAQGVEDLLDVLRSGALAVGVLDPQDQSPPRPRAKSQLYSAVLAPPMCSAPVGEGAKRTRTGWI